MSLREGVCPEAIHNKSGECLIYLIYSSFVNLDCFAFARNDVFYLINVTKL